MSKLVVFLAARAGSQPDLAALTRDVVRALAGRGRVRAVPHDDTVLTGSAHADETAEAPAYVGIVDVALDVATGVAAVLTDLGAALSVADWLDAATSSVVAGRELTVVPGEEPITLAMALTRLPSLDLAAFTEYWRTKHADLGRQVPGSEGYRQVHLDVALTDRARTVLGLGGPQFDGVALAYYSSDEALRGILGNPDITGPLLADERRFIDHSRAAMVIGPAIG